MNDNEATRLAVEGMLEIAASCHVVLSEHTKQLRRVAICASPEHFERALKSFVDQCSFEARDERSDTYVLGTRCGLSAVTKSVLIIRNGLFERQKLLSAIQKIRYPLRQQPPDYARVQRELRVIDGYIRPDARRQSGRPRVVGTNVAKAVSRQMEVA